MIAGLPWRVLQLADSAFPAGGFAHSAGLEAASHLGEARSPARLDGFVRAHLWNVGTASLPFVGAAHDAPRDVWALDARVDAFLTHHVANRASRTQGRAFAATCARVFDDPFLAALASGARAREATAHHGPIFGAALAAIGIGRRDTLALHMYLALRGVASAAVRLGLAGPLEAQRLQERHAATLDHVLGDCAALGPDAAASSAPLLDVLGATHDRLYARLFQS
ncbi:MAG TPA: urease accessory UreF family protein [Polyangiaceae bacterium]|jgi:urease accessory protein